MRMSHGRYPYSEVTFQTVSARGGCAPNSLPLAIGITAAATRQAERITFSFTSVAILSPGLILRD